MLRSRPKACWEGGETCTNRVVRVGLKKGKGHEVHKSWASFDEPSAGCLEGQRETTMAGMAQRQEKGRGVCDYFKSNILIVCTALARRSTSEIFSFKMSLIFL